MGKFVFKIYNANTPRSHLRGLILLLCLSLCPESVKADSKPAPLTPPPQQRTQTNTPDSNRAAAEKAEAEAYQLGKQKAPFLTQIIPKFEEALKYWRLAKDRKKEAKTLNEIALRYWLRGEYPKALEYAKKALPICQALGDKECEGAATSSLGLIYEKMGEYQKVIDMDLQVPSLFPKSLDLAPIVYTSVAQIYSGQLGDQKKALEYYNKALAFWKEKGDVLKQAEILDTIAIFYTISFGEIDKGFDYIKQANNLDPELKRDTSKYDLIYLGLNDSICADKLASIKKTPNIEKLENSSKQSATPNSDAAQTNRIENYKQKAEEWHKQEIIWVEADTLSDLAYFGYYSIGEYTKALGEYQKALKLRQIMGGKPEEAKTLTHIANILNKQGKKQEAINVLNQALEIQRQIKSRPEEANTLETLGDVYLSLGAYPESLRTYEQALSLSKIIGDIGDESRTLRNIGDVYRKSQNYPQALNYYQQALEISKKTGDCNYETQSLERIGRTYLAAGNYQQAINFANQTLNLSRNLGLNEYESTIEAATLNIRAQVELKQGNYSQALEDSQKARKAARESRSRDLEGIVIGSTAEAYAALKQPKKAIQTYQEQLAFYQETDFLSEQAQSLYNIAKLQRQNNQLQPALSEIDKAIKIIENIRKEVTSTDLRTSFFATVQDYYQLKIDILMELHKKQPSKGYDALALNTSERSRARGLVELLTEARANIRKGAKPELLAEESRLQDLIDAKEKLRQEIVNSNKIKDPIFQANADKFKTEIDELLSQQKELETKIRQSSPKYANLKYPKPLTLPQIQQQLDKDTLLLQYSLGKDRSYLWAVTPNSLDTYELPKREEIEKAVTEFRETLIKCQKLTTCNQFSPEEKAQALKNTAIGATKLSKIILAPVADKLGKKRLVIVADGSLQKIPFAALTEPGKGTNSQGKNTWRLEIAATQTKSACADSMKPAFAERAPTKRKAGFVCVAPDFQSEGDLSQTLFKMQPPDSYEYQPLIINHEIVNLPSVTAIATQRQELKGRKTAPKTLAILADPVFEADDMRITGKSTNRELDVSSEVEQSQLKQAGRNLNRNGWGRLQGTRTEATTILNIIPSSNNLQAFDFDANYNWVTNKQLSQYRFLHFATHGFADFTNPELSGIVLSLFLDKQGKPADRGYLRLGDIFNLDFGADLIVLSACETGLGKDVNGEGLIGLTRGLMYAGAERVAVSLWQVDDAGTAELMQQFYTQMLKQGKSPAIALRAAQLKLWQDSNWQNPYYWSAFTLQGEWR